MIVISLMLSLTMALSFANKQFPSATILMAIRWYLAYKLSYRNIEELLAERGVQVEHAIIHRWVLEGAVGPPDAMSEFCQNQKLKRRQNVCHSKEFLSTG